MANFFNLNSNSHFTALEAEETFTGAWHDMKGQSSVMVACLSSTDGTLYIDQSVDKVNIDSSLVYQVSAGINEVHRIVIAREWFRVRFVNSNTNQTYFRLQTSVGEFGLLTSPLNSAIQEDADAIIVRSIDPQVDIARGAFTGFSIVNKYGKNPDIDSASVPEDIWGGGGIYTGFPLTTLETLEVLSTSADDAASGTGARTVTITGLDGDYNIITETVTLNGTTPVATTKQFRRAHTMRTVTAGSNGVNAGVITVRHSSTESNVFLAMQIGTNQTNNSGYTIPAGYTGYIRRVTCNVKSNTATYVEGALWIRQFGEVFRQRRPFSANLDNSLIDEIYGGIVLPEKSDVVIRITLCTSENVGVAAGYDLILIRNF